MIMITIKTFGIFQDYFSDEIVLHLNDNISISDLKIEIINKFKNNSFNNLELLINKSVFSSENLILNNEYKLINNDIIYLLPPFSGG